MVIEKIIRNLILPGISFVAYIVTGDNFFLGLLALTLITYVIYEELNKLEERIKKLEKK